MHGIVLFKDKWLMIFVLQISFCITRAKCKLEVMYSVNDFRKLCTGFFVFKTFLYQMIRSNYSDTVKTAWQYNALFYLVKINFFFKTMYTSTWPWWHSLSAMVTCGLKWHHHCDQSQVMCHWYVWHIIAYRNKQPVAGISGQQRCWNREETLG